MRDYKRKNYLINPKFQLKVSAYIVVCILVSTVVYPIAIWQLFYLFGEEVSKYDPTILKTIIEQRTEVLNLLLLWGAGTVLLIFIMCIFITHRIAGPLHKLKMYIKDLPNNDHVPKLIFRKGDYFSEIATIWNESFEKMQWSNRNKVKVSSEIISELEDLKLSLAGDQSLKLQKIIDDLTI